MAKLKRGGPMHPRKPGHTTPRPARPKGEQAMGAELYQEIRRVVRELSQR